MKKLSVFEAKTNFSKVLEALVAGESPGFVITRHGKAIARLLPEASRAKAVRVGVARGLFDVPDSIDDQAVEARALFGVE